MNPEGCQTKESSSRVAAPRSMKTASPLGQGGLQGGLEGDIHPVLPTPSLTPSGGSRRRRAHRPLSLSASPPTEEGDLKRTL